MFKRSNFLPCLRQTSAFFFFNSILTIGANVIANVKISTFGNFKNFCNGDKREKRHLKYNETIVAMYMQVFRNQ